MTRHSTGPAQTRPRPATLVQLAALSARTPRCGLIAPSAITALAKGAGHDAAACADRHYAAHIPAMLEAAEREAMPVVLGLWLDLEEAGAEREHRGVPGAAPGDIFAWAKSGAGIEALAVLSSAAMRASPHGRIARAVLESHANDALGVLSTNLDAADALQERSAGIAILPLGKRASDERRRGTERSLRARAEHDNTPAVGFFPWVAPDDSEASRSAAAVISANARGSTIEARRRALGTRVGLMDAETLTAEAEPELLANAGALARTARTWRGPERAAFARPGSSPETDHAELVQRAWTGLERRLGHEPDAQYRARLERELDVIERTSFAALFLLVSDILEWERGRGGLTGPARGSAAASLVAWSMNICWPDPIAEGLLFERFLSEDRSVAPDFDLDFEPRHRAEVQDKIMTLWGRERSARICSWGTFEEKGAAARGEAVIGKAAIRAVLRAHGVPPTRCDTMLKRFEEERIVPKGRDGERLREALELATTMRDATNAVGRHASAIVLSPQPIGGALALTVDEGDPDALPAVQVDHREAERWIGAAKADCLAIDALTIIARARADAGIEGDPWTNDRETGDAAAYKRIADGETTGVFQLEGAGMTRAAATLGLENFNDLRALIAMYRPGPMDNIEPMARRKRGEESAAAPHHALDTLLEETQGIIVYQEQAIRAAVLMAGFTTVEADKLRQAISKKKAAEMSHLRDRFFEGASAKHGASTEEIETVWEAINRQAGYAFNRAHATGYSIISRATARLRQQAPGEMLAALVDVAAAAGRASERKLARVAIAAATEGIVLEAPNPANPVARSRLTRKPHGDEAGVIACTLGVISGAGAASSERWGTQAPDPERSEPAKAERWMRETLGMASGLIDAVKQANALERFPEGAPEPLPARAQRASLASRGGLRPLSAARGGDDSAPSTKALAIVESVGEQTVVLNDGDARVHVRPDAPRGRAKPVVKAGAAVIAWLRAGEPPRLDAVMSWRDADKRWPECVRVTLGAKAALDRAGAAKAALEAFRPGSALVIVRAQKGDGSWFELRTGLRIAPRQGLEAAVKAACEPHHEGCYVEVMRRQPETPISA